MSHAHHKIAMLTAGGLAPCLSSAVGGLIERYSDVAPDAPMIGYLSGYKGLLMGKSIPVTPEVRRRAHVLHGHGGSPLGNSRVKLTNVADCVKRGLVKDGEDPLKVAANQLVKDGVTILHTIGGDDTNTTAADLAAYLHANGYELTVVGLPKTIDNDVIPIRQTLGAWTAAEHGALFFENVVNEQSTSSYDSVSIFVSEGACVPEIVAEMEAKGEHVERDAFGHVRLDSVKVGDWFGKQFAKKIGADKTLVQKSGYFGRSAAANHADLDLIRAMVHVAVESALDGVSGVIGHDEEREDELRAIEFPRIKGGKHFDVHTPWFAEMLKDIGQST